MNHWSAIVVSVSFVYLVIAGGLYAYIMTKAKPYVPFLPPPITERFLQIGVFTITTGWPIILAGYGYVTFLGWMGDLAGIKWKEILPFDEMAISLAGKSTAGSTAIDMHETVDKLKALSVTEIRIEVATEEKRRTAILLRREKIDALMCAKDPIGDLLMSILCDDQDAIEGLQ